MPILICIVLSTIIYQDFRYRAVSLYWLCWIFVLALLNSASLNGWINTLHNGGINLAIIIIQVVGVFIYFSLKNKKFTNIINHQLGSGDLVFYGAMVFCFSPVNFILFSVIAYLIILLGFLILKIALRYEKNIPLAGCLAFFMLIVNLLNVLHIFEAFNDDQVLAILVK